MSRAPNYTTITVTAERTVPYAFFKLIGLSNGKVAATATAQMPLAAGCVNCTSAVATPGSEPTVIPGNICSAIGQCDVIPIGLDSSTPYTFDQPVTLNYDQVGPGNWGSLALGGTGGSNLRTNIADGYQGPLAINQWVDTEPGKKTGPIDQGFSDRISLAQSEYPSGTFLDHNPADPRVIILPMVNWNSPNGRSEVEITGFAALWVVSEERRYDPGRLHPAGSLRQHRLCERSKRRRPRQTGPDQVIPTGCQSGGASTHSHRRVGAMPWPPSFKYIDQIVDCEFGHPEPRRVTRATDVRRDHDVG